MKKIVLIILLIVLIASCGVLGYFMLKPTNSNATKICFLGDSITEQYQLKKHFPKYKVFNQGIYDELSSATLARSEKVFKEISPEIIVLLIGTNDLSRNISHDIIVDNIMKIINIANNTTGVKEIYVQSVYPLDHTTRPNHSFYGNSAIMELNQKIKSSVENIKNVAYIDMYSQLIDDKGNLKTEYNTDGLHISKSGYEKITEILNLYFNKQISYKDKICFLGDSITEQYPLSGFYLNYNIFNKGIYDELTSATLARSEKVIKDIYPDKLVLLIGTNDLSRNISHDIIVDNIIKIINIANNTTGVKEIYVQSVYPLDHTTRPNYSFYSNSAIIELNQKIKSSVENIKNATYIDMYSLLVDDKGNLKSEYNTDGLHISKTGYEKITETLLQHFSYK